MHNLEVLDNGFQTVVLCLMMILAGISGIKEQSRKLIVLACTYGSWMMGTLFYMLHLTITGDIPRIFYVSEISWMAAYLFLLFLLTLRWEEWTKKVKGSSIVILALMIGLSLYNELMGPSRIFSVGFGIISGLCMIISLDHYRWCREQDHNFPLFDVVLWGLILLQNLLYFVSEYTFDYTKWNMYYTVDVTFTLTMASLWPLLKKEVTQK